MMVSLDLKLSLPDKLVKEAEAAGLLTTEAIERLLRIELRKLRVEKLFDATDRLAALDMPALTVEEVEAEIQTARADKRLA